MEEILHSEISLLKQAITNLSSATEHNFCFGCYSFGKSPEYQTATCIVCKENICNTCDTIHNFTLFKNTVCNDCNSFLSQDNTVVFRLNDINYDETLIEQLENIIDDINDYFNNSEYHDSEINLINVVDQDSIYLICCVTNYEQDIIDELQSYLSDNDTFVLISNSETININLEILV